MTPLFRRHATDAAFERLYQRHVKDVYRYAFAVLGERADAEDVTQTTFMNAYRAFQRGERPEKPQNWLITIAHNVCRQRFRQSQRRPHEVEFDEAIGGVAVEEPDGPSVDDLRRAFSQLPPNQRAALVMRELEGRSYAEIAEVLSISVSALETLLFRARRALREQLEEQLTCSEAAFAISKQFDGRLAADEQRALRAHLRACPDCGRAANRQRAQRRALKAMLAVPLPQSLGSFFGGAAASSAGAAAAAAGGTGIAFKAAAVLTAGAVVGGGAYVGVEKSPLQHRSHATTTVAARATVKAPAPPPRVAVPVVERAAAAARARTKAKAAPAATKPRAGHGGPRVKTSPTTPVTAVGATPSAIPPGQEKQAAPPPRGNGNGTTNAAEKQRAAAARKAARTAPPAHWRTTKQEPAKPAHASSPRAKTPVTPSTSAKGKQRAKPSTGPGTPQRGKGRPAAAQAGETTTAEDATAVPDTVHGRVGRTLKPVKGAKGKAKAAPLPVVGADAP